MSKVSKLRWGLLGTARINKALIRPVRSSKNSVLAAVASRSHEKALEYAKEWGIPQYYSNYEELLEDPSIDIIYISLPNSLHAEWTIKAMQHGKHVLCEKPLTTSSNDIDKVIKIAQETGMIIAEAFMYRHHPQTMLVKELIDKGKIGNLQLIRGSFCYTNSRPADVRLDPHLGGGCLWDVGCYPISYARYIVGCEPSEVYGHQIIGNTGVDIFFVGELLFPGSIICQFECSFISPYKAHVEITGKIGRISIQSPYKPGLREKLVIDLNNQSQTIPIRGKELYSGEVEDIENAIINGKPGKISLKDSRGNIAVIEALYSSARSLLPIKLFVD